MRELLQQALDALINSRDTVWNVYQTDWRHGLPTRLSQMFAMEKECKDHDAAIAALEAELAKPANEFHPDWDTLKPYHDRIAELEAQLAKPEQKPVTWMNPYGGQMITDHAMQHFASGIEKQTYTIPLYTAPQKPGVTLTDEGKTWQGLTDEEREAIILKSYRKSHYGEPDFVAVEIEAKLREKNDPI